MDINLSNLKASELLTIAIDNHIAFGVEEQRFTHLTLQEGPVARDYVVCMTGRKYDWSTDQQLLLWRIMECESDMRAYDTFEGIAKAFVKAVDPEYAEDANELAERVSFIICSTAGPAKLHDDLLATICYTLLMPLLPERGEAIIWEDFIATFVE